MSQDTTLPSLLAALKAKIDEALQVADDVGRSRGSNCYAQNTRAVVEICELKDGIERALTAIAAQAQQAQGVPVAAEYRRGWDECMALWADHMKRMNEALNAPSKVGYFNRAAELYQNVKTALAAAPQAVQKESHAELDLHSNPARDEQQRPLVGALEMGQPLGGGQNESASNSQPKGAIARISGMDEYGPMLEWYTHWVNFKIGAEIYAAAPQAEREPLSPDQIFHLVDTHVGAPTPSLPLGLSDWINFARAIEVAHGIGTKGGDKP